LTPSLNWSAYSLRKLWNQAKDTTAPWWAENSTEAYSSAGLANLATALGNWNAPKTGKRRGPKVRFPRFTGNTACRCRFTTGALGLLERDRRHVTPPRIGTIRTLESTRIRSACHARSGTYPLGHPSPTSVDDGG
jgi:putative transposase